jgi:hypothetical protein
MSKIEVNAVEPQCGTTLTVGANGDTVSLPSGTTLSSAGTVNFSSATQTGVGRQGTVDWDTTAKTAAFTAVSGNGYFVNTTSSAITVTLPSSPSAGDIISIVDYAGTAETNNITIARNGSNIEGEASDATISTNKAARTLLYVDGTEGWKSINDSTAELITSYSAHYFVLAGGGGGGYACHAPGSGGGGGGGFRTSYDSPLAAPGCGVTVNAGSSYPITVGAGGSAGGSGSIGSKGGNSIFSTITSTGGGGGSNGNNTPSSVNDAGPGGSGGGSAYGNTGFGAGNTPPVSPPQGNNGGPGQTSYGRGQGGGGAGGAAPGGNAPGGNNDGGPGGPGVATSISGSPTTKAAGGKGGSYQNNPGGAGSEPANSGNGGAGTGCSRSAADGGSGIVIIRYTTADAPSGTSGGTKTTCGADTIHTFTGPGTFTA